MLWIIICNYVIIYIIIIIINNKMYKNCALHTKQVKIKSKKGKSKHGNYVVLLIFSPGKVISRKKEKILVDTCTLLQDFCWIKKRKGPSNNLHTMMNRVVILRVKIFQLIQQKNGNFWSVSYNKKTVSAYSFVVLLLTSSLHFIFFSFWNKKREIYKRL